MPSASTPVRSRRRTRRRGRPTAREGRDVRAALLAAARELFLKYGYRAVSARQVAQRATVDPAMVHYYFASKRGLYLAMLESVLAPLRAQLESLREGAAGPLPAGGLQQFMDAYMRTAAANPWGPALLIREVLPAGAPFRDDFLQAVVRPMAAALRAVIERAQADGTIDPRLRPEYVLISAMSLSLWPFIVRPLLPRAIGLTLEGEALEALIAHTTTLFVRGAGARS